MVASLLVVALGIVSFALGRRLRRRNALDNLGSVPMNADRLRRLAQIGNSEMR
jgi:hypothetical protein